MNEIEAVLFDYGMVLSGPPDPAAWARMRFRHRSERVRSVPRVLGQPPRLRPRLPYRPGLTGTRQLLALESRSARSRSPRSSPPIPIYGHRSTSPCSTGRQRLQRAGIRTGILSNIGDAMAEGLVARYDWIGAFHHSVWSHSLKIAKPELAIYRHAAEGLDTPPSNILFVDDREENIRAALEAGMQAIQYSSHDAFLAQMKSRKLDWLLEAKPTRILIGALLSTAHADSQIGTV